MVAVERGPIAALLEATVILDDRAVLRRASLEILPGVTVLRGANGAGKTTALRALAGLVPLARGERDVPDQLLYLGHRPQLLHGLSARENLAFFQRFRASVNDRSRATYAAHTIADSLERWGLADDADRPVERLSAGQRRRAAMARLDSEAHDVALLDEPFAELDAEAAAVLRRVLTETNGRTATLIASHGHTEIDALAVRVYQVADGAISLVKSAA